MGSMGSMGSVGMHGQGPRGAAEPSMGQGDSGRMIQGLRPVGTKNGTQLGSSHVAASGGGGGDGGGGGRAIQA
jgi:hypothetical protein